MVPPSLSLDVLIPLTRPRPYGLAALSLYFAVFGTIISKISTKGAFLGASLYGNFWFSWCLSGEDSRGVFSWVISWEEILVS